MAQILLCILKVTLQVLTRAFQWASVYSQKWVLEDRSPVEWERKSNNRFQVNRIKRGGGGEGVYNTKAGGPYWGLKADMTYSWRRSALCIVDEDDKDGWSGWAVWSRRGWASMRVVSYGHNTCNARSMTSSIKAEQFIQFKTASFRFGSRWGTI